MLSLARTTAACVTVSVAAAVLVGALAGCSSIVRTQPATSTSSQGATHGKPPISSTASSAASSVSATPATTPVALPAATQTQIGDVVASQSAINDGLLAYTMTDGSHLAVGADQPLPIAVAIDISARLKRIVDAYPLRNGSKNPTAVLSRFSQQIGRATGKQVLVIAPIFMAIDGQKPMVIWSVIDNKNLYVKALAVAYAERITAIQPDPELWLTVVSG